MVLVHVTMSFALSGLAHAQLDEPPAVIADYGPEAVAPGVWRITEDGTGSALDAREVQAGPDGSIWVLADDGAFELGVGLRSPVEQGPDRLLAVDAEGRAWLRHPAVNQQMIATWDGRSWTEVTGPRRESALRPDPLGASGVVRDMALGADGSV